VEYDVLDIDEPLFAEEYAAFQRVVQDLERRLASVIIQVGGWEGWAWGRPAVVQMQGLRGGVRRPAGRRDERCR
jgi:hypothetical protein